MVGYVELASGRTGPETCKADNETTEAPMPSRLVQDRLATVVAPKEETPVFKI
jgi:hypothetical protein